LTRTRVCSLSELAEDSAIRATIGDVAVCVARSEGGVFAVNDRCSHADVSLSEGDVEDGSVTCWLHGSAFDLRTGAPRSLPATQPVPTYAVTVEGDDVYVSLS
jgi:3-phenylpropionate/trans-cinnamate dioxygenase ferredoxin component